MELYVDVPIGRDEVLVDGEIVTFRTAEAWPTALRDLAANTLASEWSAVPLGKNEVSLAVAIIALESVERK